MQAALIKAIVITPYSVWIDQLSQDGWSVALHPILPNHRQKIRQDSAGCAANKYGIFRLGLI